MDKKLEDGAYLVYIRDGVAYPVALTEDQHEMLQISVAIIATPLTVLLKHPLGQAENIVAKLKSELIKNKEDK